jgi:hypothetical protein
MQPHFLDQRFCDRLLLFNSVRLFFRHSLTQNRKRARLMSRPSEFSFSTLKFRISNQRGVYRQIFDVYFCHRLCHLHRICNSYPLDNFRCSPSS